MVKRSLIEKILREMQAIHFRLNDLEKNLSNWSPEPREISESKLISLPDPPRRTCIFVSSKGKCNATMAPNLTKRSHALEQLEKFLEQRRKKRTEDTEENIKYKIPDNEGYATEADLAKQTEELVREKPAFNARLDAQPDDIENGEKDSAKERYLENGRRIFH